MIFRILIFIETKQGKTAKRIFLSYFNLKPSNSYV